MPLRKRPHLLATISRACTASEFGRGTLREGSSGLAKAVCWTAPRLWRTPARVGVAHLLARGASTPLSIAPVNTATNSAMPIAKPTWRDMFTMPEPEPSSWPRIEPIEPIVTAGNAAPTPTPSSASRQHAPQNDGSAGSAESANRAAAITSSAGTPNTRGGTRLDSRPTSGDTSIAMIATGVIASAALISEYPHRFTNAARS